MRYDRECDFQLIMHQKPFLGWTPSGPGELILLSWLCSKGPRDREGAQRKERKRKGVKGKGGKRKEEKGKVKERRKREGSCRHFIFSALHGMHCDKTEPHER